MKLQWIAELSGSSAARIAAAWPAIVMAGAGMLYAGARLHWWWQARKIGPNASGDVIVTVASWPIVGALLVGPPAAFLLLWFILRSAGVDSRTGG